MNCANHPETPATAYCRECGQPMCADCQRPARASVYCQAHEPALPAAFPPPPPLPPGYRESPYAAPASPYATSCNPTASPYSPGSLAAPVVDAGTHPVLALILGFFPGVGAIYNGQYAKGLVHAVVFGLLISVARNTRNSGMEGFLGVMIAIWIVYQAFEAYHTARKRRLGVPVEEFSSLLETRQAQGSRFPVSAILLIGAGVVLLLDTTEVVSMEQFERYWPVLLIALGVYLLYARLSLYTGLRPSARVDAVPSGEEARQ